MRPFIRLLQTLPINFRVFPGERPRRAFTPEFEAEIVEHCRRGDRSVGQVARDFDLTETAVRDWVTQAEIDTGERDGLTSSERE